MRFREQHPTTGQPARNLPDSEAWLRRGCALVVAGVAAYASYVHQRHFALQGGADAVSAALWPLSVDGLLLLATVGLLRLPAHRHRWRRFVVWLAFSLGIAVSLAANIAAAPTLDWKAILVAGWPPVSLLLAVELLSQHPPGQRHETAPPLEDVIPGHKGKQEKDPLLAHARRVDAQHWQQHRRPVAAETLRKELGVGSARARQLVAQLRTGLNGGQSHAGRG